MAKVWTPRPYQERMEAFVRAPNPPRARGVMLGAEMSLGKTAIVARVITRDLYQDFEVNRWLVVGPKQVALHTWTDEFAKWTFCQHVPVRRVGFADLDLTPEIIDPPEVEHPVGEDVFWRVEGGVVERGAPLAAWHSEYGPDFVCAGAKGVLTWSQDGTALVKPPKRKGPLVFRDKRNTKRRLLRLDEPVHVCSWEAFPFLVKAYGKNWPYRGLILDESDFAKNPNSDRNVAARSVAPRCSKIVELSGLPDPNGYEDLWGQMLILDGGARLGATLTEFRGRFMMPGRKFGNGSHEWRMRPGAGIEVLDALSDIVVTLRTDDYLSLPPQIENRIALDLPPEVRTLYDQLEQDLVVLMDDDGELVGAGAAALRLKLLQIANGRVYLEDKSVRRLHDLKIDEVEHIVNTTQGGVLIAYQFIPDKTAILKRLGSRAITLDDRDAKGRFERGEVKCLVMHGAAGGHGVDGLQLACSTVVWCGLTDNLAHVKQLNARIRRTGQKADRVIVHYIVARDTREDDVAQNLDRKEALDDVLKERLKLRTGRRSSALAPG